MLKQKEFVQNFDLFDCGNQKPGVGQENYRYDRLDGKDNRKGSEMKCWNL